MKDWVAILREGTVFISTDKRGSRRRLIYHNGTQYRYHRVFWRVNNKDDTLGASFDIHHIDGDTLNDSIDNLQKLSKADHARLHNSGKKHNLYGVGHTQDSKALISRNKRKWEASREQLDLLRRSGFSWAQVGEIIGANSESIRRTYVKGYV